MKYRRLANALFFLAATSLSIQAQSPPASAPQPPAPQVGSIAGHPGWPVARPADVASPEALLAAVYEMISGAAGQPHDWDRMRSLFLPDARLIPTTILPGSPDSANPHTDAVVLTIDAYIARSRARKTTIGYLERGIHNEVEQYGNIVQVWSTYEGLHSPTDPAPFARGINSFQLLKDGNRYWVANIFWSAETPTTPLPAKYLPASH